MSKKVVLAFSGGLDTSFCIPYLLDQGYEVHTLFVNTGGIPKKEERAITKRASELGAKKHINILSAAGAARLPGALLTIRHHLGRGVSLLCVFCKQKIYMFF